MEMGNSPSPSPEKKKKKASFFKVMIGDFEREIRIPPDFKKKHLHGRRKLFSLRGPDAGDGDGGRLWRVECERSSEGWFFLRSGWRRFASHHGVAIGDFLVFDYDGEAVFDVTIFGLNACEKLPPPATTEEDNVGGEMIGGASAAIGASSEGPIYAKRTKRVVIESVLRAACGFRTSRPYFMATCRSDRFSHMTIPRPLVREYNLSAGSRVVLEDPEGGEWPVELTGYADDRRIRMKKGWPEFLRGNRLEEGDVCVFEFVEQGRIKVHVFRGK